MRSLERVMLLLALLSWSSRGLAQSAPRAPPQAALDACSRLRAGDACSFALESRALEGVCRAGPERSQVACAPKDMPQRPHHGPPPEAVSACASLRTGDACIVTFEARTMEGICRAGPERSQVACAPKDMPPRPHHGPPPEAVSACASLRTGDACIVTFEARTMEGICRAGPEGSQVACAPKDMPPPPSGR
jgi:hypothetical protein